MAITTNATLLIRRGLEMDFNASKMKQGEWALSTDTRYVRMCVADGICLRMATYESFEEDMTIVEQIVQECRDLKTAIEAIETNLLGKISELEVFVDDTKVEMQELVDQAREYMENAIYVHFKYSPDGVEMTDVPTLSTEYLGVYSGHSMEAPTNPEEYKWVRTKGETGERGIQGDTGETGNGIDHIEKVGTQDLVDTYRVVFTDGNTFYYYVTNGRDAGSTEWSNVLNKPFNTLGENFTVEDGELQLTGEFGVKNYNDLENRPSINNVTLEGNKTLAQLGVPSKLSDLASDSTHRTVTDTEKSNWNSKSDFDGNYNSLLNKPTIPAALSELTDDSTHRTVTDAEKTKWNGASFSGDYNDLSNKPSLFGSAAAYSSTTSYTVGTFVIYNNALYVCIKAAKGYAPTNTTYWAPCNLTNTGGIRFGISGDGNYGYYGADGSLIPFSSAISADSVDYIADWSSTGPLTVTYTFKASGKFTCIIEGGGTNYINTVSVAFTNASKKKNIKTISTSTTYIEIDEYTANVGDTIKFTSTTSGAGKGRFIMVYK